MPDFIELNRAGLNRFAGLIGLRFDSIDDGRCVCTLDVRDDLFHPGGVVHGGAAFSLADSSMAMALMSKLGPDKAGTTIELKINYLAPVREGTMRCESWIVRQGRRVAFMESRVQVGDNVVATATATFAIIDIEDRG